MAGKAFVLCIAPELGAHQVVCVVSDNSPKTLACRLGGKYRKEGDHPVIDFSAIWGTLPPLTEDTPGLEDYIQDLLFDEESLDQYRVLAVGSVNIALEETPSVLYVFEVPFADLSSE